jgi:hypothetical protein
MSHHLHSQNLRVALYRVFVQPALIDLRLQRNQIPIFCPSIAQFQRRTKTTKKQKLARDGGESETGEIKAKRSYADRVAEREAAGTNM